MTGGSQAQQAEGRRWVHRRGEGTLRNGRAADVFFSLKQQNMKTHSQLSACIVPVCDRVCLCTCLCVFVCIYI